MYIIKIFLLCVLLVQEVQEHQEILWPPKTKWQIIFRTTNINYKYLFCKIVILRLIANYWSVNKCQITFKCSWSKAVYSTIQYSWSFLQQSHCNISVNFTVCKFSTFYFFLGVRLVHDTNTWKWTSRQLQQFILIWVQCNNLQPKCTELFTCWPVCALFLSDWCY